MVGAFGSTSATDEIQTNDMSQYYSQRHYRAVGGFYSRDTPDAIADRLRRSIARDRAAEDMKARFPAGITLENAAEAIAYQEARLKFHGATT